VHSEVDKKGVGRACLNFYRLRKTTVTSILTGTIFVSVDWLTSEHSQLFELSCLVFCLVAYEILTYLLHGAESFLRS
jgi:hypothetical protein